MNLLDDLRTALRSLRRRPGFAATRVTLLGHGEPRHLACRAAARLDPARVLREE